MANRQWQSISPAELARHASAGEAVLVDVRTPAEFQEIHVPFAINLPLDALRPEQLPNTETDAPIYVICRSGSRAKMACDQLARTGRPLALVEGGTEAWAAAGFEVVRGKAVMSLERQVRIAAGSLVLLGIVLSLLVHPWALGLSAFVGAGLVFAGVTDTCGMGMLLARMPWNRAGGTCRGPACSA